jgi:hypothetical protein
MAHLPVLVDFWSHATDPLHTLTEVWGDLVSDYTGIASITDHKIVQTLDNNSTMTFIKDETGDKIILRYDHEGIGPVSIGD